LRGPREGRDESGHDENGKRAQHGLPPQLQT
jgi:hypothetical protein